MIQDWYLFVNRDKVKKRPLKCSAQAKRDKGGGVPATITKHSKDLYSLSEDTSNYHFLSVLSRDLGIKKFPFTLSLSKCGEFWKAILQLQRFF